MDNIAQNKRGQTSGIFTFGLDNEAEVTFFIVDDCYPEGAACYFYRMFENQNGVVVGGFIDRFFRNNLEARIIANPNGDYVDEFYQKSSYQYSVTNVEGMLHLYVEKVIWHPRFQYPEKSAEYNGRLDNFVNRFSKLGQPKIINDCG